MNIYTGQTKGIDPDGKPLITGFITKLDNLGEIETPNGNVKVYFNDWCRNLFLCCDASALKCDLND